ncbi:MAG: FAD-binding protein [Bacteroidota bacterium]
MTGPRLLDEKAQLVVVGGGLAAYAAALAAARQGIEVLLIPDGGKSWALFGGSFAAGVQIQSEPFEALVELYASTAYPLVAAKPAEPFFLPTTMGTVRTADLTPEEFQAGDLRRADPILLVGWRELPAFSPAWAAAAIRQRLVEWAGRSGDGSAAPTVLAGTLAISQVLPQLSSGHTPVDGDYPGFNWRALAREMEQPESRRQLASALNQALVKADLPRPVRQARDEGRLRVALPIVGLNLAQSVRREVYDLTGLVLCELIGLLPAPGGIRAKTILDKALVSAGVAVRPGWKVTRIVAGEKPTACGRVQGTEEGFAITGEYLVLAPDLATDPLSCLAARLPHDFRHAEGRLVRAGAALYLYTDDKGETRPVSGGTHAFLWASGYQAGQEAAANLVGRIDTQAAGGSRVGEGGR